MMKYALLIAFAALQAGTAFGRLPALRVSENHRFLITADGKPFFWLGDTAWELFHRLNREEADHYLENRAKKGFTVVQVVAIAELDGDIVPNAYGDLPFVELDPTRPALKDRPAHDYWQDVDYIVDKGNALGSELAGYKLLVTSVRTGDTEVFVVDPETGDARNLSRSPDSEDRYPCWSPDGRQVAFTSNRDWPRQSGPEGFYSLYVMDADGGNVKRLVHREAVCYMPSWQKTSEGERIVFGLHGARPEMASIRPDGTDLKILGEGHDPTLSPDGKSICYTGEVSGGVTVFVMDADGGNKRRVVRDVSKVGATFPNWSPDSRQIVYSFPVGQPLELFVINADGTGNRQLTHTGKICTPAAWSPDGKWISFRYTDERYWSDKTKMDRVYEEKPSAKRPVWVIRPDGSDAHVIECLRFQCAIDGSRASWKPQ